MNGETLPTYYNEIDKYCCEWLRNLMDEGLIPMGVVDDRPIQEVTADDLEPYGSCHFFAGLGGWAYALRLAGWPDERPVWTGSCPCQPFSVAGRRKGVADERHLWPYFCRLIAQRMPPVCYGEQVAAATEWLCGVRSDLEDLGYAVAAIPIEAASAGAWQYRDRFWFVASQSRISQRESQHTIGANARQSTWADSGGAGAGCSSLVARNDQPVVRRIASTGQRPDAQSNYRNSAGIVAHKHVKGSQIGSSKPGDSRQEQPPGERDRPGRVVIPTVNGWGEGWTIDEFQRRGIAAAVASISGQQFIECPDGKFRPLPPPRVRWVGNGLWVTMDAVCSYWIGEAQKEILNYAQKSGRSSREVVRMVRQKVQPKAFGWKEPAGGFKRLSEKEVLLGILFRIEAVLNRTPDDSGGTKESTSSSGKGVCGLRGNHHTGGSPPRRESKEQCPGESTDSLSTLSQFLACCAKAISQAASFPDDKTLGRAWRSARVAKLRALGNAIHPPTAAAFIKAFMQSEFILSSPSLFT